MEQPVLEPAPIRDANIAGNGFTCCTTPLAFKYTSSWLIERVGISNETITTHGRLASIHFYLQRDERLHRKIKFIKVCSKGQMGHRECMGPVGIVKPSSWKYSMDEEVDRPIHWTYSMGNEGSMLQERKEQVKAWGFCPWCTRGVNLSCGLFLPFTLSVCFLKVSWKAIFKIRSQSFCLLVGEGWHWR